MWIMWIFKKHNFLCIKLIILIHTYNQIESAVRRNKMFFDNLYNKENKEAYKSYSEVYYSNRSHQDNTYQYCTFCGADRIFLYDRCETCKNN